MSNNLFLYDILIAQVKVGAVVYKVTPDVADDGLITIITVPEQPYKLHLIHPNLLDSFIHGCAENDISIIPFAYMVKAEREALGKRLKI